MGKTCYTLDSFDLAKKIVDYLVGEIDELSGDSDLRAGLDTGICDLLKKYEIQN